MCVCVCVCVYTHERACVRACHVCVCVCVCVSICLCVCLSVSVHQPYTSQTSFWLLTLIAPEKSRIEKKRLAFLHPMSGMICVEANQHWSCFEVNILAKTLMATCIRALMNRFDSNLV